MSTSHLVPDDALIFSVAERGDLTAVRKMFERGLASPNVYRESVESRTRTLIEVSASDEMVERLS